MNRLVIIGASGHGKVVADIALQCGYSTICFLDDDESVKFCMNFPVVGKVEDAKQYADADFFVAIGNAHVRKRILEYLLNNKFNIVTLVHPMAVLANDVVVGQGTVIMAGTVINSGTVIGKGCIVNTGATIDHDNKIHNYVHISVGSHTAGTVSVGEFTWIGAGAVVSNNISIAMECMIGAGAVVIRDIPSKCTVVGNPAKPIKHSN